MHKDKVFTLMEISIFIKRYSRFEVALFDMIL